MKRFHKQFEQYLEQQDGRYTTQKRTIVEAMLKAKGHFEIEDVLDILRRDDTGASRATVYRLVKQLLDANLLQKINAKDGKIVYEPLLKAKEHDHLICNSCGKIIELKEDSIQTLLENLCQDIGFKPEYRSIHIYGQCEHCQAKQA